MKNVIIHVSKPEDDKMHGQEGDQWRGFLHNIATQKGIDEKKQMLAEGVWKFDLHCELLPFSATVFQASYFGLRYNVFFLGEDAFEITS